MAAHMVTIEVRTRFALWMARRVFALRWIVGAERAQRWAWNTTYRLARLRIERGPWHRFKVQL